MKKNVLVKRICSSLPVLLLSQMLAFVSHGAPAKGSLGALSAWKAPTGEWISAKSVSVDPTNAERFAIIPGKGVIVNGPNGKAPDLVSAQEFGDIEVHLELCIPKH